MSDETEFPRKVLQTLINAQETDREELEKRYGKVWDTAELQQDFTVRGFVAPFVVVTRKSDGVKGVLMFQHAPRFYFCFEES